MKDRVIPTSGNHSLCRLLTLLLVTLSCLGQTATSGQQAPKSGSSKVPPENSTNTMAQPEVIARLFGAVSDLKKESDKASAALLLSEIADVLWKFDEPAARSLFRLAFDNLHESSPTNLSSSDSTAKRESALQSRRRAAALKTILKRFAFRDRKGAEMWLREFEDNINSERAKSNSDYRMSSEQAELLAEMAVSFVSQNPKEAQRLGLLSLTSREIPLAFGRLLMALRDRDKALSDVLFRQALVSMRRNGFPYSMALVSITNYQFFSNGGRFPDASVGDVLLAVQYFVDASTAQAARFRSGSIRGTEEQASMGSLYNFLAQRAVPIVALNAPDKLTLMHSNISEMAQGLTRDQRRQADLLATVAQQKFYSSDTSDSDIDSQIQRAEREKNEATRSFMLRHLALQLMRRDPGRALSVARKIDDQKTRAQTEDEVLLVLLQKAFASRSYDEASTLALKFNDRNSQARWLTRVASNISPRVEDQTEVSNLLSRAHAIAEKADNTPAKVEVLLVIAKEFVALDQIRGFEVLSDAVTTANRLEKAEPKPQQSSVPMMRVVSVTMVDGQEVFGDERVTIESIDFNQIGSFAERDALRVSLLANDLKDALLRTKYLIAMSRHILRVPRQGPGYERTLSDLMLN